MQSVTGLLTTLLGVLLPLALGGCPMVAMTGCDTVQPVEKVVNTFQQEVVGPAIKKALEQGVENASIHASGQLTNPTYVVTFEGKLVQGVEGRASIGVEGVAAQGSLATTSTEKTMRSPYAKDIVAEASLIASNAALPEEYRVLLLRHVLKLDPPAAPEPEAPDGVGGEPPVVGDPNPAAREEETAVDGPVSPGP